RSRLFRLARTGRTTVLQLNHFVGSRLNGRDEPVSSRCIFADELQTVRRQFDDRDSSFRQILLVAQILIRRDEDVDFGILSGRQQLAVFQSLPAAFKGSRDGAILEKLAKWTRHAVVEQDRLHAASFVISLRACSRTAKASLRETPSNAAKNSSRLM